MFTTDFYVCGLGPMGTDLVLLGYNSSAVATGDDSWLRPQMRVVKPSQGTYEELSKDELDIKGYAEYQAYHYHLGWCIESCED